MISTEKHKKHADLKRPVFGEYGRHEYAFVGAPCGVIQDLASKVLSHLEARWNVGYVDADHASGDQDPLPPYTGSFSLTDKIAYHQLNFTTGAGLYERRALFNPYDLILINGNHFKGKSQVVLIHEAKKESLKRKLDRLTDIKLVILTGKLDAPFDFIQERMSPDTTILHLEDTGAILNWFEVSMTSNVADVYGLALAGGKSMRLGHDKTVIDYHGGPQRDVLFEALQQRCRNAFISCRSEQIADLKFSDHALPDQLSGLGPYGGILTAFQHNPNVAWLVVATDLPFAIDQAIDTLLTERDPSKMATTFHNEKTNFPDPLATIWEPKAYPVMLNFLSQGYSCPRKVLINADIKELNPLDPKWLHNVNTPEDLSEARELLD